MAIPVLTDPYGTLQANVLTHWCFRTLSDRKQHHPHFTGEETEALVQGSKWRSQDSNCGRSQNANPQPVFLTTPIPLEELNWDPAGLGYHPSSPSSSQWGLVDTEGSRADEVGIPGDRRGEQALTVNTHDDRNPFFWTKWNHIWLVHHQWVS